MNGDGCATNAPFFKLDRITARNQRHDDAALLHYSVRTRESISADRIEHGVHSFGHLFKFGFSVIDRHVYLQLLEQVLVCSRSSGDDTCAARFRDLHGEATDTA